MIDTNDDGTRVIALSAMDNIMARCYAKTLVCFSLNPIMTVDNAYSILRAALSITVSEMPIWGGKVYLQPDTRPNWKLGQLEVRVPENIDPNDQFPLDFLNLSHKMDYEYLQDAGFPEEELEGTTFLSRVFTTDLAAGLETGVDSTIIQATFCRGGCILGLGIWHSLTDAYGMWVMSEKWALNCKRLQADPMGNWTVGIPTSIVNANNDREILSRLWRKEAENSVSNGEMNDTSASSERLWNYLGLHPPSLTVNTASAWDGSTSETTRLMRTCMFYISNRAFKNLKNDLVPPGSKAERAQTTVNDCLNGLIWRSVMKARFPDITKEDDTVDATFITLVDGRLHFSKLLPDTYLGNMIFFASATLPLSVVIGQSTSISDLAVHIRKSVDSYTKADMHAAYAIAENIDDYSNLSYTFAELHGPSMNVSSSLHVPLSSVDFGPMFSAGDVGKPDAIRVAKDELDQVFRRVLILPMTRNASVEILISLYDDEMNRLLMNKEFGKYAQFTSY